MRHLRYPPEGNYQKVIIFVKEIELSSSIERVAFHRVFWEKKDRNVLLTFQMTFVKEKVFF